MDFTTLAMHAIKMMPQNLPSAEIPAINKNLAPVKKNPYDF